MSERRSAAAEEQRDEGGRAITRLKLADLKPHPRQAATFGDQAQVEFERLKKDMKANGLKVPIEVLCDGTIIKGHQRVRAAKELEWTEVDGWVRSDLTVDNSERELITDNFHRRHFDPVVIARCIKRLVELDNPRSRAESVDGTVRDYLGKQFKMSGRNLARYLSLLKTPREVQDAVSQKKLPLVLAARVASLQSQTQSEIADAIRKGDNPEAVVRKHLTQANGHVKDPYAVVGGLARSIESAWHALEGRREKLGMLPFGHLASLEKGRRLFEQLLQEHQEAAKEREMADKGCEDFDLDDLGDLEGLDDKPSGPPM